ncbi:hypothetical protein HS088_TW14G00219 [Tripterygium wilfordii]|uniref:Uncharacterized protein n=1 Tax=Tripterygium wilfordii TaxID=458696 RepID=A0A7J7CPR1_TRIWF|nr:hypothetical protein HS088_TW14G00219 [Tripterygium wilfordii]
MESKGTERINEQGAVETKVETVDYQSPAGEDKDPRLEKVGVVHLRRDDGRSGNKGGVLAGAAAAVANTFKSAKNAIVGSGKDDAAK